MTVTCETLDDPFGTPVPYTSYGTQAYGINDNGQTVGW